MVGLPCCFQRWLSESYLPAGNFGVFFVAGRQMTHLRLQLFFECHDSKMLGQPLCFSNLPPGHAVTETTVPRQLRHQSLVAGAHWAQLWDY